MFVFSSCRFMPIFLSNIMRHSRGNRHEQNLPCASHRRRTTGTLTIDQAREGSSFSGQTCPIKTERVLERIEKAERVVPLMQATVEGVSHDVRQQGRDLDLAQPAAYARHAHLMPLYSLDRAATKPLSEGQALRALAERLRPPL